MVCTGSTLYSLSAETMAQLYYQNPKLGFHVMRMIVARLMHDADRLKSALRHLQRSNPPLDRWVARKQRHQPARRAIEHGGKYAV